MKHLTGTIDTITPAQRDIVDRLRHAFKLELAEFPELDSQWYILRFCRARSFDYAKVELMMRNMFAYRRTKDMHRISNMDIHSFEVVERNYPAGVYNVDYSGRPIFIDCLGATNVTELLKEDNLQLLEDYYIQRIERQIFIQFPMASQAAGKRVDNIFMIMDLKGISMTNLFSTKLKNFLKYLAKFSQDYYPEMLGKMFIVNAPFAIKVIWNMVKPWLDKKTSEKIEIHNNVPLKRLAEYLDVDKLPTFMGGKSTIPLHESPGPWETAIEESRRNHTLLLTDRSAELKYFRVECDPKPRSASTSVGNMNTDPNITFLKYARSNTNNVETTYNSDIKYSRTINGSRITVMERLFNDEADRYTDVRKLDTRIGLKSLIL